MLIPGVAKTDLPIFYEAREAYDKIGSWEEKLLMHSWLLDLGVLLCEQSIRFDNMAGECIWGCACWVIVPHKAIRGEAEPSVHLPALQQAHIAPFLSSVVPTP